MAGRGEEDGHYGRLMKELNVEDPRSFFNYLTMEPAMFNELVQRVMGPSQARYQDEDATTTRDVPTAFEPRSSSYRQFPTTFEVHSS